MIGKSVNQAINLAFFAAVRYVILRTMFEVRALRPRQASISPYNWLDTNLRIKGIFWICFRRQAANEVA